LSHRFEAEKIIKNSDLMTKLAEWQLSHFFS